jgi:trk system potassium uptake protein TrkA
MQVIICGAGMVGTTLAKYLVSENNNVTLIEKNKDVLDKVTNNLEIKPICGYASHPSVLEEAGAANADMIIAVTRNDEVNMVACQVAHSLFNVPTKIARVRFLDYINPVWSELYAEKNMPIDAIISPEEEMAKAVIRRLEIPDAIEVINLADDKIKFIGVRCSSDIAAINLHIAEFPKVFPELNLNIVCLVRNNKSIVLRPNEKIIEGDEVYFTVDAAQISRAMRVFGEQKDQAHKILIFGGGNVGFKIASTL